MEARCQDETPYPPATLMQLVAGIQHNFREKGQPSLAIFGDKDPRFAWIHGALDARMKQLTKEGVGTETKQAHRNKKRNCGALAFFRCVLVGGSQISSFGTTANSQTLGRDVCTTTTSGLFLRLDLSTHSL